MSDQTTLTLPEALNLAMSHQKAGRLQQAEVIYQNILKAQPNHPAANHLLGVLAIQGGRYEVATSLIKKAIQCQPNIADFHLNLGSAYLLAKKFDQAITCFRQALTLQPNLAEAFCNLGIALWETERWHDAIVSYNQALAFKPNYPTALFNLGLALANQGQSEKALTYYQKSHEHLPNSYRYLSSYLFMLSHLRINDPGIIIDTHQKMEQIHARVGRGKIQPHDITARSANPRLRIGYVSPDFRNHAVSYFIEPILRNHDRSRFEIFAYAEVSKPDATTHKLRSRVDTWRSTIKLSDEQLAKTIHADQIDILVDLAGHTINNRLTTFTYKPAPIQATYLGYFATTGLKSMDYWITDTTIHPQDDMQWTTESLYRLPRCYMCYQPRAGLPEPVKSPRGDETVIFGSFNTMGKIMPKVLNAWCQILQRAPNSRLLLKNKMLGDKHLAEEMLAYFTHHGIEPKRIHLVARVPTYNDHMAMYSEMDIALDTFPYTGATTTADALWMGVPVVTLAGRHFVERMSLSLLSAVGHPEWSAENLDDYVDLAVDMAARGVRSSQERQALRQQMAASPLCDPQGMTQSLEEAYRKMWLMKVAEQEE
ncbi:MAG: tetratricopeptide repeat protein [Magnetococcales bacterium]|nr:tetratricopeptide repeat protein [Magnetococcales bacterium]